jgi:hypothetical protein
MVTPIMIDKITWGTYVFFAAMNACFIPIIWLFYPETKKRSLEEIDLIFAKGYLEKTSYVQASHDMPYLTDAEVDVMAKQYGFTGADDEFAAGEKRNSESVSRDSEKISDEIHEAARKSSE